MRNATKCNSYLDAIELILILLCGTFAGVGLGYIVSLFLR